MTMLTKSILAISLAYLSAPALAASNCALGQTCPISTHIQITPASGDQYRCVIDPQGSKLKMWVHAAGNYKFAMTGGYNDGDKTSGKPYNFYFKGRFTNPSDLNQKGEIRFRRYWGKGTVTCVPHSGSWD